MRQPAATRTRRDPHGIGDRRRHLRRVRRRRAGRSLIGSIGSIGEQGGCGASGVPAAAARGRRRRSSLGPAGVRQLVGATEYGGPGDPQVGLTGARGDNLLAAPRHLRRARRADLADGHGDGGPAVHDAAADHLGQPFRDRLQARLRPRRRPDRRAAARDRPVVAVRRRGSGSPIRTACGRAACGSSARRRPVRRMLLGQTAAAIRPR